MHRIILWFWWETMNPQCSWSKKTYFQSGCSHVWWRTQSLIWGFDSFCSLPELTRIPNEVSKWNIHFIYTWRLKNSPKLINRVYLPWLSHNCSHFNYLTFSWTTPQHKPLPKIRWVSYGLLQLHKWSYLSLLMFLPDGIISSLSAFHMPFTPQILT